MYAGARMRRIPSLAGRAGFPALALGAVVSGIVAVAAGCGYPSFQFDPAGTGGMGTTGTTSSSGSQSSSGTTGSTTSSSSSSSSHSSSSSGTGTGGAPPVCGDHVVISEIRTRGANGGTDEFVELYNPTSQDVVLGPDWSIASRADTDFYDTTRWQGNGGILPAHGHYLIAGSGYGGAPARDDGLSSGISDAGRVRLIQSPDPFTNNVIDAVCFAFDSTSRNLVGLLSCPGSSATNPHDDTTASDFDRSIMRWPRDCTDTGDNSKDLAAKMPSTPMSSQSPPVVY